MVPVRGDPAGRLGRARVVAPPARRPDPGRIPRAAGRRVPPPTGEAFMTASIRRTVAALAAALFVVAAPAPGRAASEALAKLCDEYWQGYLESHPTTATSLGDRRYDDRLEDISLAGQQREDKRDAALLARVRA